MRKKQQNQKILNLFQRLHLSSTIFFEILKGGDTMMVRFLALTILDGLMSLDEIKNKKLRRLVKAELDKMGVGEVAEEANK